MNEKKRASRHVSSIVSHRIIEFQEIEIVHETRALQPKVFNWKILDQLNLD